MIIQTEEELAGMRAIGEVVGATLRAMREYAKPGMSTRELDEYGNQLLLSYGARSAPKLMYNFPGWNCISINQEAAHGIPSEKVILQEGDLVNIDVSAELNGFFADNGGSFILGADLQQLQPLVDASQRILNEAIQAISADQRIAETGRHIQQAARAAGFRVIKNLVGHGVGRSLHEPPTEIPCYYDPFNRERFKENAVIAVETFISTRGAYVVEQADGWTMKAPKGSFVAQHEHTLLVTAGRPVILTAANGI